MKKLKSLLSPADERRGELITEIAQNCGAEANGYAPIRSLLCETLCGIALESQSVVIDTPLKDGSRPDVQIWLDIPAVLRSEHEHLFAVIEGKQNDIVKKKGIKIAEEKIPLYRRGLMRYYWQYDALVVERYDLSGPTQVPEPTIWSWDDLRSSSAFNACFEPLMNDNLKLDNILRAFETSPTSVTKSAVVDLASRQMFIQSIITVARILSRAVTGLVDSHLIPDLKQAHTALETMADYGSLSFDWSNEEYIAFSDEPEPDQRAELRVFNRKYTHVLDSLEPFKYAMRAETETLPLQTSKGTSSTVKVSFLSKTKESKAAREAFIQETASLLLSRLLMIRFSEDHGFLKKYISNGGIAAFSHYSTHFRHPYQILVREAYDNARPVYKHLFERKALDWIIERNDEIFGRNLLHAMWILARWQFQTVRGDILSGVYDKYLEPTQRKQLGEIYTRPELARYVIERCNWDETKTLLDPACGSGTFLVEAFDLAQERSEKTGLGFDMDDAISLLTKLNGLDINEFSATLAKIQLLWHVLGCASMDEEKRIRDAIQVLRIEGGHSSLETWGLPMVQDVSLALDFSEGTKKRRSLKVADRRFRDISSAEQQYDVVVGNPPYVRKHRVQMSDETMRQYDEVDHMSTDLAVYFVYRAIRWWLKEGGRMAFFLPFALSEAAYAEKLRNILGPYKLVELVDLELLGNTAFHGANVVTMVLIVEKTPASPNDLVQITTLDASSLDLLSGRIDVSRATTSLRLRSDITLFKYLPSVAECSEMSTEDEEDDDQPSGSEWLLKVKSDDVQILDTLTSSSRLDSLLLYGYEKRGNKKLKTETSRVLVLPEGENSALWTRKALAGYGVKIGGTLPPHTDAALPVYKGADVFPDGVSGLPMAYWDGSPDSVDTVRFYGWDSQVSDVRSRCYAFRQISLSLTVAQHPEGCYLQNTTYLVQLAVDFPLNIYVLSRIPSWFMLKTARTSVMSGSMRTTWYRRNLLRIPVPPTIEESFVSELREIGKRLFNYDAEIVSSRNLLESFTDQTAGLCLPLKNRKDLLEASRIGPLADIAWPEKDMEWIGAEAVATNEGIEFLTPTALFPLLPAPTESGEVCRIPVPDLQLRKWLRWYATETLAEGKLPSMNWLRNAPIPNDLGAALETLERTETNQALIDLRTCIDELDSLVAVQLGITVAQQAYIKEEMTTDPLLSKLQPAWKHTAGRRRLYTEYGEERTY